MQYYKYTSRINISHSIDSNDKIVRQNEHFHSIEVELYINNTKEITVSEFISYDLVEEKLAEYFDKYAGTYVNEREPFNKIIPTIENMGFIFYYEIKQKLESFGYSLSKLEIGEIPSRKFVVTDYIFNGYTTNDSSVRDKKIEAYVNRMESIVNRSINFSIIENRRNDNENEIEETGSESINIEEVIKGKKEESFDTRVSNTKQEKRNNTERFWLATGILLVISVVMVFCVKRYLSYPFGDDVYIYLGKADYLYSQLINGHFAPIFMESWYNGYQMFSTSAPVPYYLLAIFEYVAQGDVINGYLLLLGFAFFCSAFGWVLIGRRKGNVWLALVIGILWPILPGNSSVIMKDGNIPFMVFIMLIPYLINFVNGYFIDKSKRKMFGIVFITVLMVLTNPYLAVLFICGLGILLALYALYNYKMKNTKQEKKGIFTKILLGVFVGFVAALPWLYQGVMAGALNTSFASDYQIYLGLGIALIVIFSLFLSKGKTKPGFVFAIVMYLMAMGSYIPALDSLWLSKLLFNIHLLTLSYVGIYVGLQEWKKCKKSVMSILVVIIAITTINGVLKLDVLSNDSSAWERVEEKAEELHIHHAASITTKRLMLFDIGNDESFPAFYLENAGKEINFSYDLVNNGSIIKSNINQLNYALYSKHFDYLFDRCIETGNDTILIKINDLKITEIEEAELISAAKNVGYKLVERDDESYLFHMDVSQQFGVVTDYEGLAIGTSANIISLIYPYFEEGNSSNIEDYEIEDLLMYKKIYLSGFTYNSLDSAENIVKKLSDNGIEVYIDMNNIPVDSLTNRMKFLDVTAQTISFSDQYPELIYDGGAVSTNRFFQEYSSWGTVYLDNLDDELGYSWIDGRKILFCGTKYNDKIKFIGFNIVYHAVETDDEKVVSNILDKIFGLSFGQRPTRNIYPLEYSYNGSSITIDAPVDNLNTTLSYQVSFKSNQVIYRRNNLLTVNSGVTTITFTYDKVMVGIILSIVILTALSIVGWILRKRHRE